MITVFSVILSNAKNLKTQSGCNQILRSAQDDTEVITHNSQLITEYHVPRPRTITRKAVASAD